MVVHLEFESRKLRRRRDRWWFRLWLARAVARFVLAVVLMTCLAGSVVRHSLIDGHPSGVPPGPVSIGEIGLCIGCVCATRSAS